MKVKITTVAKQLPAHSRKTAEVIPFVKQWMSGQDNRFQRKVIKIFEGAGVDCAPDEQEAARGDQRQGVLQDPERAVDEAERAHRRLAPRLRHLVVEVGVLELLEAELERLLEDHDVDPLAEEHAQERLADPEPALDPGFLTAPRVALAPHIGSATYRSRDEMARIVAANVTAVLDGAIRPPPPGVRSRTSVSSARVSKYSFSLRDCDPPLLKLTPKPIQMRKKKNWLPIILKAIPIRMMANNC